MGLSHHDLQARNNSQWLLDQKVKEANILRVLTCNVGSLINCAAR